MMSVMSGTDDLMVALAYSAYWGVAPPNPAPLGRQPAQSHYFRDDISIFYTPNCYEFLK
jgi:hypothetical protein